MYTHAQTINLGNIYRERERKKRERGAFCVSLYVLRLCGAWSLELCSGFKVEGTVSLTEFRSHEPYNRQERSKQAPTWRVFGLIYDCINI